MYGINNVTILNLYQEFRFNRIIAFFVIFWIYSFFDDNNIYFLIVQDIFIIIGKTE